MRKLIKHILSCVGILLLILLGLLIVAGSFWEFGSILKRVVLYVGNGSVTRGIFFTPFFIFGIIQIIRSFLLIGSKAQQEAAEGQFRFFSKKSEKGFDLGGIYVILTFVCYLLVFFIIV